jgi:uncharacterized protein
VFGIGLRHVHYEHLLEHEPTGVDWFEAIAENHFEPGGRPWAVLERVGAKVPIVLHGVAMGIGNAERLSVEYLDRLRAVIERVRPPWISDHLCWCASDGRSSHDLLPLPYDEETLEHVVSRVAWVQEHLGRPLILENITRYLGFTRETIPEADFLNELARRTGCGVLLDVNNLRVNEVNLGIPARACIERLDVGIVKQIHLAGHTAYPDEVIDTHVGPVPASVWDLYRLALERFGAVPTLVEWDEEIPDFPSVAAEAARARAVTEEVCGAR